MTSALGLTLGSAGGQTFSFGAGGTSPGLTPGRPDLVSATNRSPPARHADTGELAAAAGSIHPTAASQRGGADQHHPRPDPGNNTSTTVTSRIDSADLRITKTASVSAGTVGQTFSYVITFDNAGPSAAANVTPDRRPGRPDPGQRHQQRGHTANQHQRGPDRDPGQPSSGAGGTLT